MDLENTVISLLVGSEKSKSHPGTQAKPSSDAQGPGCPSYSGGGKDPLSLLKTTTTTHASPLDLTALAAAMPDPTPINESAWTLVAPKYRKTKTKGKKTNKRTDKHTDRQQDKRTDNLRDNTEIRDSRGGKRKDSDCPNDNNIVLARGNMDTNEGLTPRSGDSTLAEACTPTARLGDKLSCGLGPGPTYAPQTSGVLSHNAEAGQTEVKGRVNNGGHTDPEGISTQTRSATGLGISNNTRTPTTTKPEITDTNPYSLPSTRARPRARKRNRGTHNDKPQNPETSSSILNKKRERLDDTISPRGEHKRPRTDHRQTRDRTDTYAKAALSHLSVAVTTTPRVELTQIEANIIQGQIQEAIFATCIAPVQPGQTRYAPAFDGRAFLSEGVLKMWCLDDRALGWLKAQIPKLPSPRSGVRLTVIRQTEIPVRLRSGLFVPDFNGDIGTLHKVLTAQNPWYGVSQWTLFSHQPTKSNPPGMFLILGIPSEEIPCIMARGRKVAYSTGSIYIRFFTNEGLSDVPPGQIATPEGHEGPEVEKMDVIELTDEYPPTSEPSVSTVLDNIEAVLTDSREFITKVRDTNTPSNASDITAPADQVPARRANH